MLVSYLNFFDAFLVLILELFLGIPYADSFFVLLHYCMKSTVDDSTVMSVHAQIKYKKSVWGVIKGFIEKNTWLGLEDFYEALSKALMAEYCLPPAKAKSRRTRKGTSIPSPAISSTQPALPAKHPEIDEANKTVTRHSTGLGDRQMAKTGEIENATGSSRQEKLSWVVIFLLVSLIAFNVILYMKLWKIDHEIYDDVDHIEQKFEFLR